MQKSGNKIELNRNLNHQYSNNNGIYLSCIAIFLFVIYIFSQRWFDLVLQTKSLQIAILTFVIVLLLFKPTSNRTIQISYTKIDLLWTNAIIIILLYIVAVGIVDYEIQFLMYIIGILFLLLAKIDIKRFEASFKFIKIAALLYALATIFHYLFPAIFHSIIFPLVPFSVKERTLELVSLNYYPGLGFAQPAISAGYMIMGLGIILAGLEFRGKLKVKILDILLILILMMAIIMAGKRSILLWGILAALATYYFSASKKDKIRRIMIPAITLIIGIIIFFLTTNLFNSIPFFERIIDTINGLKAGKDITSGRTILYGGAWELFKENPILGIGWEQYANVTSGWFFSRDLSVHNVYLQLLSETGLVGFVAVMLPLLSVYFISFKSLKLLREINIYNYYQWKTGLTFSIYYQTFFLLYCFTENPFYNIIYILMYFFSISIVNSFIVYKSCIDRKSKY